MKKKRNKLINLLYPEELLKSLKLHYRAFLIKYSHLLGTKTAPFPTHLIFDINENCNAFCKMCSLANRGYKGGMPPQEFLKTRGNLPFENFCKVIDSVARYRPGIWFMSAEPLLYPYFIDSARYVKSKNLDFAFTTNGIKLPEFSEDVVKAGVDKVLVSLVGGDSQTHDEIVGVKGAFERAKEGVLKVNEIKKKLRKKVPSIAINFIIVPENHRQLHKAISNLVQWDVDKITMAHTQFVTEEMAERHNNSCHAFKVDSKWISAVDPYKIDGNILWQELKKIFREFKKMELATVPQLKSKEELIKYYTRFHEPIKGYGICYYPWRFAHVLSDGRVVVSWYLCRAFELGSIYEKDFYQIWNDAPMKEFRSMIKEKKGIFPFCSRCGFLWCSYNM